MAGTMIWTPCPHEQYKKCVNYQDSCNHCIRNVNYVALLAGDYRDYYCEAYTIKGKKVKKYKGDKK